MAGPDQILLLGLETDRSGDLVAEEGLTLLGLQRRIEVALREGFPLDTPVKYGYVPSALRAGVLVDRPEDLTTLRFEDLRRRAIKNNAETSVPAWAEIERRVEALAAYEA